MCYECPKFRGLFSVTSKLRLHLRSSELWRKGKLQPLMHFQPLNKWDKQPEMTACYVTRTLPLMKLHIICVTFSLITHYKIKLFMNVLLYSYDHIFKMFFPFIKIEEIDDISIHFKGRTEFRCPLFKSKNNSNKATLGEETWSTISFQPRQHILKTFITICFCIFFPVCIPSINLCRSFYYKQCNVQNQGQQFFCCCAKHSKQCPASPFGVTLTDLATHKHAVKLCQLVCVCSFNSRKPDSFQVFEVAECSDRPCRKASPVLLHWSLLCLLRILLKWSPPESF